MRMARFVKRPHLRRSLRVPLRAAAGERRERKREKASEGKKSERAALQAFFFSCAVATSLACVSPIQGSEQPLIILKSICLKG
jgi:hypothetical protein